MGANRSRHPASAAGEVTAILDAFRGITHALRVASRKAETRVGLSAAQLFVLHKLADAPAASLNELAERTHTHQSSVSVVVARLVSQGLVMSIAATSDGRRRELRLTDAGREKIGGEAELVQDRLVEAIRQLPATRRHRLAADLTAIARALDDGKAAPAMFFEEHAAAPSSQPKSKNRRPARKPISQRASRAPRGVSHG
jgi:DNA-binding MarR family transcriptional regulator